MSLTRRTRLRRKGVRPGIRRPGIRRTALVRDPVTATVYDAVMARDGHRCVGPRVGLDGLCTGPLELDHILSAGLGKRGPGVINNLVVLCRSHHRYKTEHSKATRPALIFWVHNAAARRGAKA